MQETACLSDGRPAAERTQCERKKNICRKNCRRALGQCTLKSNPRKRMSGHKITEIVFSCIGFRGVVHRWGKRRTLGRYRTSRSALVTR
eukprot:2451814-Rhodomonas_salina.2